MKFAQLKKLKQTLKASSGKVIRLQFLAIEDHGMFRFKDGSRYEILPEMQGKTIRLETNLQTDKQTLKIIE